LNDTSNDAVESSAGPGPEDRQRDQRFAALSLMLVGAVFCGVVGGLMLAVWMIDGSAAPDLSAFEQQRAALSDEPDNPGALAAVRQTDVEVRTRYFVNRRRLATGAVLLLLGAAVVVVAGRWYGAQDPKRPYPGDPTARKDPEQWLRRRRRAVIGVCVGAVALVSVLTVLRLCGGSDFPHEGAWLQAAAGPAEDGGADATPPSAEVAASPDGTWPRFRGPTGMGTVPAGDWPRTWNETDGTGIVWKTPVPMPGKSSPIIWGDRVFLTGADEDKQEVMCYDRASGELLWRTAVAAERDTEDQLNVFDDTGHAAPTPVTDGKRVYAFFATADLAAVDFAGNLVWAKNMGSPENTYGIAVSPIVYGDKLILQFDRGEADEGLSALLALDSASGDVVWRRDRPVRQSWTTPVVVETDEGPEIVTLADPYVIFYDAETGAELRRAGEVSGDAAPSPVFSDGTVYAVIEYSAVMAVQTGGSGDVSETNVLWRNDEAVISDAPSPVCDGELFLQVHSSGMMTCHDAATGEIIWEHDLAETVWASPTLVGNVVYLPEMNGRTRLFELGREYAEVGSGSVNEKVYASPAFVGGRIYIRGDQHLFCIGRPDEVASSGE